MREDEVIESEPEWFSNPTKIIQTTLDGRWIFDNLDTEQSNLLESNTEKSSEGIE